MAHPSPFRSHDLAVRQEATHLILGKRQEEIVELEEKLRDSLPAPLRHTLRLNLSASKNNLKSWEAYLLQGCPRDPRATTIP